MVDVANIPLACALLERGIRFYLSLNILQHYISSLQIIVYLVTAIIE